MTYAATSEQPAMLFPTMGISELIGHRRVNFLRAGLTVGALAGTLSLPAATAFATEPVPPQYFSIPDHTVAVPLPPEPSGVDNLSVGSALQRLRAVSGLNWGEVAMALRVSRRTVHNWLSGSRIAPFHLERVAELVQLVGATAAGQPADTRLVLTSPASNGRTLLEEFALQSRPASHGATAGVRVADLLAPDASPDPRAPATEPTRKSALRPSVVRSQPRR